MRCDPTRTRAPGRPSSPWRRRRRAATTRSACRGTLWPTVSTRSTSSCHARPRRRPLSAARATSMSSTSRPRPTSPSRPRRPRRACRSRTPPTPRSSATGTPAINVAFDQLMYERPEDRGRRAVRVRRPHLLVPRRRPSTRRPPDPPLSDDGVLVNLILILYDTTPAELGDRAPAATRTPRWPGLRLRVQHEDRGRYRVLHRRHGVADRALHAPGPAVRAAPSATSSATRSTRRGCGQNMGDHARRALPGATTRRPCASPRWLRARHTSTLRVYVSLDHTAGRRRTTRASPTRYYAGRDDPRPAWPRSAATTRRLRLARRASTRTPKTCSSPTSGTTRRRRGISTPRRVHVQEPRGAPGTTSTAPMTYRGARAGSSFPSRVSHTRAGADGERLQAAGYALAYYKVAFLDEHRRVHPAPPRRPPAGGRPAPRLAALGRQAVSRRPLPGRRKLAYDVFRGSTPGSLRATEFAKPIVGIDDWAEAVPRFDPAPLARRLEPWRAGMRLTDRLTGAFAPRAAGRPPRTWFPPRRWPATPSSCASTPRRRCGVVRSAGSLGLGRLAHAVALRHDPGAAGAAGDVPARCPLRGQIEGLRCRRTRCRRPRRGAAGRERARSPSTSRVAGPLPADAREGVGPRHHERRLGGHDRSRCAAARAPGRARSAEPGRLRRRWTARRPAARSR